MKTLTATFTEIDCLVNIQVHTNYSHIYWNQLSGKYPGPYTLTTLFLLPTSILTPLCICIRWLSEWYERSVLTLLNCGQLVFHHSVWILHVLLQYFILLQHCIEGKHVQIVPLHTWNMCVLDWGLININQILQYTVSNMSPTLLASFSSIASTLFSFCAWVCIRMLFIHWILAECIF